MLSPAERARWRATEKLKMSFSCSPRASYGKVASDEKIEAGFFLPSDDLVRRQEDAQERVEGGGDRKRFPGTKVYKKKSWSTGLLMAHEAALYIHMKWTLSRCNPSLGAFRDSRAMLTMVGNVTECPDISTRQ